MTIPPWKLLPTSEERKREGKERGTQEFVALWPPPAVVVD